jgi:hypothetical protein
VQIEIVHPDKRIGPALLMDAFGSADREFVDGVMSQLANAGSHGKEVDEGGLNFLVSYRLRLIDS